MLLRDSRSVPHIYTIMVTVSFPSPSSRVYFSRAPGATEVFSLPVLASLCQPEDTLPPPSPPSTWAQFVPG